jgi:chromosomal replication initiator protein
LSPNPPFSPAQVWQDALGQLLLRVTRQNYETWLRNTAGLRFEGTTLVVAAGNELNCDWLSTRMRSVVTQSLTAVAGSGLQVRFETADPDNSENMPPPLQPSLVAESCTQLNPRFHFENFMEAGFNRLALTAAKDIAAGSTRHTPLFITGPSGYGKTHLLHATAHDVASTSCLRVLLVSAEEFLSDFVTAIKNNTGAAFRGRYRSPDVLLIDDVQYLLGKKATLNEFYETVAGMHDQGKLVVVAGDASAATGAGSRFQTMLRWGLVAAISQPTMEERIKYVSTKAAALGVQLPEEVQHYIALRVRTSIRELEGAVNRVAALAQISRERVSIDFAAAALQPVAPLSNRLENCTPSSIIAAVCNQLEVDQVSISSKKRDRNLTYARHLAMYLLRGHLAMSYTAIAHLMGKKDHSTVMHACRQIHKEAAQSPELRADIDAVLASLRTMPPDADSF